MFVGILLIDLIDFVDFVATVEVDQLSVETYFETKSKFRQLSVVILSSFTSPA